MMILIYYLNFVCIGYKNKFNSIFFFGKGDIYVLFIMVKLILVFLRAGSLLVSFFVIVIIFRLVEYLLFMMFLISVYLFWGEDLVNIRRLG